MSADGSCQGDDGLDAAVGGPEEPFVEILLGFFRRLEIKILKGEAELIGFGRFEVASGEIEGGEWFTPADAVLSFVDGIGWAA